ncbi:hypothetical protein BC835DRAFT_1324065 [Cytidiella melzeri]|nr:hypothetical protein BC835DRAFT_1324065 [Cytidiella melzeri]
MNSLTYISRQLDVLAAARTPPSTPSLDNAPLYGEGDQEASTSLKRVHTWSQRSFVPTPLSSAAAVPWLLRRSYSSPAGVNPAEASSSSTPHTTARTSSTALGSHPPSRRPSISSPDKPPRLNRVESIFYRVFFVRVLVSLWHYTFALWRSMTAKPEPQGSRQIVAEEVSDEDEKDTEDEGKQEKPPLHIPPATPVPPPLPLPATGLPSLSRNNTDPGVLYLDLNSSSRPSSSSSPLAGPPSSFASVRIGDQSRTTTPPGSVMRRPPLHLPKTLVLDLDETLIHSTSRPMDNGASGSGILNSLGFGRRDKGVGYTVEVVLGGRSTLYHVYKRPFVDYFLRKVRATRVRPLST